VYRIKKLKNGQGPTMGYRAIDREMIESAEVTLEA
jgi:hypothetical protein